MKTSELSGAQLDWAVGRCRGLTLELHGVVPYSTDWVHGGPVIEQEKINVRFITPNASTPSCWAYMSMKSDDFNVEEWGDTPLVAAMRCYVASKLGEEIEIPEELK